MFRLGDGILLVIRRGRTRVVDLERGLHSGLDPAAEAGLELAAAGKPLTGHEGLIPSLAAAGLIAPGPLAADPLMRGRLAELDADWLAGYEAALTPRARLAYRLTLEAHARRRRFVDDVGQCPCLPETALRRALLVGDAADAGAKRVVCIGDDDLVGVALAALGHEVTVYDIDDFLLDVVRDCAAAFALPITAARVDLTAASWSPPAVPFDVFLTDPMSNYDCLELFLARGFALVGPRGTGYTAAFGGVGPLFERLAGQMGFSVGAWLARFNRYYDPVDMALHDYESDWVAVAPTDQTRLEPTGSAALLYKEHFAERPPHRVFVVDPVRDVGLLTGSILRALAEALREGGALPEAEPRLSAAGGRELLFCGNDGAYLLASAEAGAGRLVIDTRGLTAAQCRAIERVLAACLAVPGGAVVTSGTTLAHQTHLGPRRAGDVFDTLLWPVSNEPPP